MLGIQNAEYAHDWDSAHGSFGVCTCLRWRVHYARLLGESQQTLTLGSSEQTLISGSSEQSLISGSSEQTLFSGSSEQTLISGSSEQTLISGFIFGFIFEFPNFLIFTLLS